MKERNLIKLVTPAAVTAALVISTSCTSTSAPDPAPQGQLEQVAITGGSEPGMYLLQTTKVAAAVTAVNSEKREVTVVFPEDKKEVIKAGPEVINFDQIKVGDKLSIAIAEEMVVTLATDEAQPPDGSMSVASAAAPGEKPGLVMGETSQITAKVIAIDRKNRKVLIQTPDGKSHEFDIRKDLDLSKRKVGEELLIRYSQALSIVIE